MESSSPSPGLTHNDPLPRTAPRWPGLLLACFILVPQLARAQTCEWSGGPWDSRERER